jgi:hypothetical protein
VSGALVNLNLASGRRLNGFTGFDGVVVFSNLAPADILSADVQADGFDSQTIPVAPTAFRITDIQLALPAQVMIQHESETNSYYVLYQGESVRQVNRLLAVVLGTPQLHTFSTAAQGQTSFYRVQRVPLDQPLDSDGDGINDAYELFRPAFLNPLDPADALRDYDGDGRTNLQEYQAGTDPAVPDK